MPYLILYKDVHDRYVRTPEPNNKQEISIYERSVYISTLTSEFIKITY